MASNTSTTCSGCKWEHSSGRFQKKAERTGYIWTYDCPGTACANWKNGTPTNMHWGCSKYQKREPRAVQMTIWDFMKEDCLETLPEEDMVRQIGSALRVDFKKDGFFGDYRARVGKSILSVEYDRFSDDGVECDFKKGDRFIGCDFIDGNNGASAPCLSVQEAIEWFEHYRRKSIENKRR